MPSASYELLELGQTFGLGQINIVLQATVSKGSRKADILTTRTDKYELYLKKELVANLCIAKE